MDCKERSTIDRVELPVDKHRRSLLYLLEKQRIVIVVGETGSGKSTRIPQILFSAGIYSEQAKDGSFIKSRALCITQPRRVAAVQLAQRVADDLNCRLGTTVGYAIRFKDVTDSEQTMIKFLTEGLLVKEMMFDPLLTKYSVVIVDEVHERNLNTDVLLGLLKCIMIKRKDLRLIICSATLNIDELSRFFSYDKEIVEQNANLDSPSVLCVQGRSFPIKVYYRKEPIANYLHATIETVISIHESNRLATGKILAFMTGQDEVDYVCDKLVEHSQTYASRLDLKKLLVLPLHASLQPEEISKVFDSYPKNTRVCIVSTNVAETSLTIDDIAFVIDCGFAKLKFYDYKTGIDSLVKVPISKSSARQRAGRAGRTRDGSVYRLYTEAEYKRLDENTVPEIQRSSLSETILLLKSMGVDNLQAFPLISPMPSDHLVATLEILHSLKAIDESGQLTACGELMSLFNLDPKISKILVNPETAYCTLEKCRIAAMLQVKDIYQKSGRFRQASSLWTNSYLADLCVSEGDPLTYLNVINGFINNNKSQRWAEKRNLNYLALLNAVEIAEKLESQLTRRSIKIISCNGRTESIQKSLLSGLFLNAAYLHPGGNYKTIKGDQTVHIHPTSVLGEIVDRPKYVVFVEILNTTKPFMRHIMSVESSWLLDVAPHFYKFATDSELQLNKRN